MGVVRFIRSHSCAPWLLFILSWVVDWGSLGTSGIVGFTLVHSGGCSVHPGSLGTLACALGVVGFILGRLVCLRAPCLSLGSSGVTWFTLGVVASVVRFTHARLGGRWFHQGSLGSVACTLRVFGFISGRLVNSRTPWGS